MSESLATEMASGVTVVALGIPFFAFFRGISVRIWSFYRNDSLTSSIVPRTSMSVCPTNINGTSLSALTLNSGTPTSLHSAF